MAMKNHDVGLNLTSIGIDIGKDLFHIVGFDTSGTGQVSVAIVGSQPIFLEWHGRWF